MSFALKPLPRWIVSWLFISSIICSIDAIFVLTRPQSFEWPMYSLYSNIYIHVDKQYGELHNGFVIAQSWLNLAEVLINIICIIVYLQNNITWSNLLAFAVTIMTFWKTVLYSCTDIFGGPNGFIYTGHNTMTRWMAFYLIPNSVWLIVPFIIIYKLTKQFTQQKIHDKSKAN